MGPGVALPGEILFESPEAVELLMDGQRLFTLALPGQVLLPELPAGRHSLNARTGSRSIKTEIDLPAQGQLRVAFGESIIVLGVGPERPASEQRGGQVSLEIRPTDRSSYELLFQGGRRVRIVDGAPLILKDLAPGEHLVELFSSDRLILWARGTILLEPGMNVLLEIEEGRSPRAFFPASAWRPGP